MSAAPVLLKEAMQNRGAERRRVRGIGAQRRLGVILVDMNSPVPHLGLKDARGSAIYAYPSAAK